MSEMWLAPSTSPTGERQMRVAPVRGEKGADLVDPRAAQLIAHEQEVTGVEDSEAMAMMRLYSGLPVEEALYDGLDRIPDALDPAEQLLGAVNAQLTEEDSEDPHNRYDTLYEVIDGNYVVSRSMIYFLGETGLAVAHISGEDRWKPVVVDYSESQTDDVAVAEAVRTYEAPIMAYVQELVYGEPDESGTTPELLSRRCHTALGRLTTDGAFEHVVTVLDPEHPARQ